jgi:Flp pilus assembly protein TadD
MTGKTRRQQIEELLAEDPDDAFLRYGLAMEHVSEGDDESAVRCLENLTAVAADYVPAYLQLGQALARLGRPEQARRAWGRGVEVARRQGDRHAADEMQGFLDGLG